MLGGFGGVGFWVQGLQYVKISSTFFLGGGGGGGHASRHTGTQGG